MSEWTVTKNSLLKIPGGFRICEGEPVHSLVTNLKPTYAATKWGFLQWQQCFQFLQWYDINKCTMLIMIQCW